MSTLKAPFPYFGGKSGAASLVWERFGNTPNYVEPFAGSLAVLLARPHAPKTETINDLDGLLSNAWRAIRADPDAVAYYADQPVVEVDLHARHTLLVNARETITARLMADPDYYDAKLAGFWVWGACNWIGSGWCDGSGPWVVRDGLLVKRERAELAGVARKLPHLGDGGKGVSKQLPHLGNAGTGDASSSIGISKQVPYLASQGVGDTNALGGGISRKLPSLGSAEIGISNLSGDGIRRKIPNLTSHGSGTNSEQAINPGVLAWMRDLSARLRRVRMCCGSWDRVVGPSVTTKHGLTAVFLDPPYNASDADNAVYGLDHDGAVSVAARSWAIENGNDPLLRIALCGYDGEHEMPEGWTKEPWKARKGYQKVKDGAHNGQREVIWFSPHCLKPVIQKRRHEQRQARQESLWVTP